MDSEKQLKVISPIKDEIPGKLKNKIEKETKQMKNKFKVIGVGAAGNKAVIELINSSKISVEDTELINSTSKDFPSNYEGEGITISPDNTGCGKERKIAKGYVIEAIKSGKIAVAEDYDSVCIVTSVEGGTGSGSAPMLAKYISEVLGKNVIIFAFSGFANDARGLSNTVEFYKELPESCSVVSIKNSDFLAETKGNRLMAETLANKEFVTKFNVINCNSWLNYNVGVNMDDTDVYKVVNSVGYKLIEYKEFDKMFDPEEDFNKVIKTMLGSSKSYKPDQKGIAQLGVILNIKPENEDFVDYDFSLIENEFGTAYEKYYHVQYDGAKQFIAFIASGLMMPTESIEKVYNEYLEKSKSVNKADDLFFDKISGFEKNKEDSQFDMIQTKQKSSLDDFLKNI